MCCRLLSHSAHVGATSFSPTIVPPSTAVVMTLTGVGLDATNVRAVAVSLGTACAIATPITPTAFLGTTLTFSLPAGGLASGAYSVCISWLVDPSFLYTEAPGGFLFVPSLTSATFSPLAISISNASPVVSITGTGQSSRLTLCFCCFHAHSNNTHQQVSPLLLCAVFALNSLCLRVHPLLPHPTLSSVLVSWLRRRSPSSPSHNQRPLRVASMLCALIYRSTHL